LYLKYLVKPLLDFELYNTEDYRNKQQVEKEGYYEELDLSGGIKGIDYEIEYVVNCEDDE
jgi:hypothetical protein